MAKILKPKSKYLFESGKLADSRVKYRVVLADKKGKKKAFKVATHFFVFYGKKKIYFRQIPKARKTLPRKREFIFKIVNSIEKKRLKIIKTKKYYLGLKRNRIRKAKRVIAIADVQAENAVKALDKHHEAFEEARLVVARALEQTEEEQLDLSYVTFEEPLTLKSATQEYVLRVPFKPKNEEYRKEWIQKRISSEGESLILELDIINFNLLKNYIPISHDPRVFKQAIVEATTRIYPHLVEGWKLFVDEPIFGHLFRLKYLRQTASHGWVEQGISGSRRTFIDSIEALRAEFASTFEKFKGEREPHSRELRTKNYLEGEQVLYIYGFTLEMAQRNER